MWGCMRGELWLWTFGVDDRFGALLIRLLSHLQQIQAAGPAEWPGLPDFAPRVLRGQGRASKVLGGLGSQRRRALRILCTCSAGMTRTGPGGLGQHPLTDLCFAGWVSQIISQGNPHPKGNQAVLPGTSIARLCPRERYCIAWTAERQSYPSCSCRPAARERHDVGVYHLQLLESSALQL